LIVTAVVYRSLSWHDFDQVLCQGLQDHRCGAVFDRYLQRLWLLFGDVLGAELTGGLMATVTENPWMIFLMINLVLFLLGTFLDMAPTLLICTPIFLPIAQKFGMDPTQFGVVMLLNCALGLNTPPVGTTQFVGCAIGGISVGQVMRSIWPFYGALLGCLMLVTYVPAFSLWLPKLILN